MVAVTLSVTNTPQQQSYAPSYSALPCKVISGTNKVAYYSNYPGQRIVNAEAGVCTNYRVGSLDENLFFKVADTTRRNAMGDADTFFYDSPEQYLNHRFSRIRYNTKSKNGNMKRNQMDKARKDYMLENRENEMIHWSLVDVRGAPTDDTSRAYMKPYINPGYLARWTARKAERVAHLNASFNDSE